MISILFLLLVFLHGLIIASQRKTNALITIVSGFIIGSLISVSLLYWVTCLTKSLDLSLVLFFFFSTQLILIFRTRYLHCLRVLKQLTKKEITMVTILFFFSLYLFSKTFGYDSTHGTFLIASNVYVDFGAHIPFIRSFSLGNNFPGEVPFFQNSGLLYYFLFDFYTGVLEHLGLTIATAYNLLSALSFTSLLILIYQFSTTAFKRKAVGVLSVMFFIFSSNLSFISFFQKYGINMHMFSSWWHTNVYLENVPIFFAKNIPIEIFWNVNTYMNQRHFIFGVAFFLLFLLLWITSEKKRRQNNATIIIFGVSLGFLVMWHAMIFIAIYIGSIVILFLYPHTRKQLTITLFIATLIALPQILLIKLHSSNTVLFQPGFLLSNMLTVKNELLFWFLNVGLGSITLLLGFIVSNREQKKIFFIFLPLFIIPNLIHISGRFPFDDHKFFNLWILGMGMFSAFFIVKLFSKHLIGKFLACLGILLLTLSGIISIMVIKNDVNATLPDFSKNIFLQKAKEIIPSNAVVVTNGEIYDPITLIGKKIFIGRAQYIYVYGGDAAERLLIQKNLLQPLAGGGMMDTIKKNRIQYLVIYKNGFAKNEKAYNLKYYPPSLKKMYEDTNGIIYKI